MVVKTKNSKQCLICGREKSRLQRGLCTTHYGQYRRLRDALNDEAAAKWEEAQIKAGKLLPDARWGKSADDAFADDFEKFIAENPDALKTTVEEDVSEIKAGKNSGNREATKKTKTTKKKAQ